MRANVQGTNAQLAEKTHTPNPAKARFTLQQVAGSLANPYVNSIRFWIQLKVPAVYHFGTTRSELSTDTIQLTTRSHTQ